ncbi:MAG: acylglycerol kinase family protein, partial [Lachnospiraceae bacterium]|nr:acylglycerol kinase family protein [Lachnospiraceae bacterium]
MKYYFIVNPGSRTGKAKELWDEMQKRLERSGKEFEVFYTKGQNDAKNAAESICKKDAAMKRIVVVGGDGTLNEAVNGIPAGAKVMLGVIPTGSSNDFARGVGIISDPMKAFERILNPRYFEKIDVGITRFSAKHTLIPKGESQEVKAGAEEACESQEAKAGAEEACESQEVKAGAEEACEKEARFAVSSSIGYDAQICHKALVSRLKKFLNRIG